jgi:trans-aconitate methyltransferase
MDDLWHEVWSRRSGYEESPALERAIRLDGFDGAGDAIEPNEWRRYVTGLARRANIGGGSTVFEIGCGAGAFLIPLSEMGVVVAGIDYSASLIAAGRTLLPNADLQVGDARECTLDKRFDHIVSHSMFQYLPDHKVALRLITLMVAHATETVGIFDVSDEAQRLQSLAARRSLEGDGYEERYDGLEHLYFERSWLTAAAAELGCAAEFYASDLNGHRNAAYRYSAVLTKDRA